MTLTMTRVRIDMKISGVGNEGHEWEFCPIHLGARIGGNRCPIRKMECKYGLTEIEPPHLCPIRGGVEMKFSIVEFKE